MKVISNPCIKYGFYVELRPGCQRSSSSEHMEDTWLCPSFPLPVLRVRTLFIACMLCGLMQKPLIKFAWDVQAFLQVLTRGHSTIVARGGGADSTCGGGAASLLGGTAILLRQVFATKGQAVIAAQASALAVAGKHWSKCSLLELCRLLEKLEPCDNMKRQGRMVQSSGPQWIRDLLRQSDRLRRFHVASECLGKFLTSAVVQNSAFHQTCTTLKSAKAKLFHVGDYSVPR